MSIQHRRFHGAAGFLTGEVIDRYWGVAEPAESSAEHRSKKGRRGKRTGGKRGRKHRWVTTKHATFCRPGCTTNVYTCANWHE